MNLELLKTVVKVGAIALVTLPVSPGSSGAEPSLVTRSNISSDRNLTGQWVMASLSPDPQVRQQNGKYGVSVTQNGNRVRVQPQTGFPVVGQISGQQVRVNLTPNQYILGRISNDANRVFLTPSGSTQATAILVRVGSPGCPNKGNWNSTISSCSVSR